jgi:hypothetical protein
MIGRTCSKIVQDKSWLNSVSILFFVLAIGLSNKVSKGAKLEFDEQASSASASISMSVHAGTGSDEDVWEDTGILYNHTLSAYAADSNGALASGSSSVHSDVNSAYSNDEDGYIDPTIIFEFIYNQHFSASPFEDANHHITPASFSVNLGASGNLYWNLLPSNPNEKEGDLVVIGLWDRGSVGATSTNMIYQMGTTKEYWAGSQKLGPYHVSCFCPSCDCNTNDPHGPIGLIARLGDKIKLSYNANVDGHSSDGTQYSAYYDSVYGPSIQLSIRAKAELLNIILGDKRWLSEHNLLNALQNREELSPEIEQEAEAHAIVEGACADGATQLILYFDLIELLFEPNDIPADTETPTTVRLSILSPDGKDNGYLIEEGQDNDNDGYDDTPRIKDEGFTQTWCAPPVFDSVEKDANTAQSRQIQVQIEIDKDGDGIYDCNFIEYVELVRTPVILVHGWCGGSAMWTDLIAKLDDANITHHEFDYNLGTGDPKEYASQLENWVNQLRDDGELMGGKYAGKFDIVSYSFGAMVSRYYMEVLLGREDAQKQIRQWIGLAPVNNGAAMADYETLLPHFLHFLFPCSVGVPAVHEMKIKSNTLAKMNYGLNMFDINIWGDPQLLATGVKYRNLIGINEPNMDRSFSIFGGKSVVVMKKQKNQDCYLDYYTTYQGDGLVAMKQAMLQGDSKWVGNEVFKDRSHSGTKRRPETAIFRAPDVLERAVAYLNDANLAMVNNCPQSDPNSDHFVMGSGNQGNIFTSERKDIKFPVDSRTRNIGVSLGWKGSKLTLTLIAPSGTIMEPNVAPVTEYEETDTSVWYAIDAPETGEWTARIDAIDVPSGGESFGLATLYSSLLTLRVAPLNEQTTFHKDELATVTAILNDENTPMIGATVTGQLKRPDSSMEEIIFYDDGTNGDVLANDGCYTNQELLTEVGTYEITVAAKGMVDETAFERTYPITLWVFPLADLNYDSTIDFLDFAFFAKRWMQTQCNDPNWCEWADINHSGEVDFVDLKIFADHWLEGTWHPIPGDLNGDNKINFVDFALFANHWMNQNCAETNWCEGADLERNGSVDLYDLGKFAEYWLEGTIP